MAVVTLFSQAATGSSIVSDGTSYTMGVQFQVSSSGNTLDAIWFYSATGAGVLPYAITLFGVSGGTTIHSEGSVGTPISWSGAAGSGWVKASFASPPSLTASTAYVAGVTTDAVGSNWYSATGSYWTSGAGSGGITNAPLSAPSAASSTNGQNVFNVGTTVTFPATSGSGNNFWIDPEVTTSGGSTNTANASLALTPTFAQTLLRPADAKLNVVPGFATTLLRPGDAALHVVPLFTARAVNTRLLKGSGNPVTDEHRSKWWLLFP